MLIFILIKGVRILVWLIVCEGYVFSISNNYYYSGIGAGLKFELYLIVQI